MTDPAAESAPLRVLVVDADERTRESLVGLLSIGSKCIVVGSAGHPLDALAQIDRSTPDVIIIDPRLPELDGGRALITRIRELSPVVRVLVMGWPNTFEQGGPLNGVDGFIRKTFRPRDLVDAVVSTARRTDQA